MMKITWIIWVQPSTFGWFFTFTILYVAGVTALNNQISDLNIDWEQRSNQKILIHENFRDNYLTELDYQECCDEFLNGIYSVTDGFQKYKANAKSSKIRLLGIKD